MKRIRHFLEKVDWPNKLIDFLIVLIGAGLLYHIIEKGRDERNITLSARYGYYAALHNKHMEIIDETIRNRQKAIEWFDLFEHYGLNTNTEKWEQISTASKQSNSRLLVYMPSVWVNRLLEFDNIFFGAVNDLLRNPQEVKRIRNDHRHEISAQFDSLISLSRELVMNDSLFYSIRQTVLE